MKLDIHPSSQMKRKLTRVTSCGYPQWHKLRYLKVGALFFNLYCFLLWSHFAVEILFGGVPRAFSSSGHTWEAILRQVHPFIWWAPTSYKYLYLWTHLKLGGRSRLTGTRHWSLVQVLKASSAAISVNRASIMPPLKPKATHAFAYCGNCGISYMHLVKTMKGKRPSLNNRRLLRQGKNQQARGLCLHFDTKLC